MQTQDDPLTYISRLVQQDPAYTLPFLRAVDACQVWVAGKIIAPFEPGSFIEILDKVSLHSLTDENGETYIPFYSDREAAQTLDQSQPYIGLPARTLFEITRGSTLIFNYLTDFSLGIPPDAIDLFLNEQYDAFTTTKSLDDSHLVMYGLPNCYPQKLVDTLTALFAHRSSIKQAFLTGSANLLDGGEPRLCVGVLVDQPDPTIAGDIRRIVYDTTQDEYPMQVLWLNENIDYDSRSIEAYMLREEEPFYRRD